MNRTQTPEEAPGTSTLADVFPDFAISLDEATRRDKMLQQFVREHMIEGEDYGVIPGSNKPTLFKPGAEKLNTIFGFAPQVTITSRTEDWEKSFVSYEVKVSLINKRTGMIEAEGLGSCNSRERKYSRQDAAGIANTVLKMAKKRALVDATLSATRASGSFAQDLEDQEQQGGSGAHGAAERGQRAEPALGNGRETGSAGAASEARTPASAASAENAQHTNGSGGNHLLTDAQHRAILAIASRVFGRPATGEDFSQLADKPLEELTKGEASTLIDRLRYRLAENQSGGQSQRGGDGRSDS